MNVLISACLLGLSCRYDGQSKQYPAVSQLQQREDIHLIPFCPEQAGGLPTPRDPSERKGEAVITSGGRDVTEAYRRGARQALELARLFHCSLAVLKEKSPSCGCGRIYDGSFTRTLTDGDGVTTQLLKENGLTVIGEGQIAACFCTDPLLK